MRVVTAINAPPSWVRERGHSSANDAPTPDDVPVVVAEGADEAVASAYAAVCAARKYAGTRVPTVNVDALLEETLAACQVSAQNHKEHARREKRDARREGTQHPSPDGKMSEFMYRDSDGDGDGDSGKTPRVRG